MARARSLTHEFVQHELLLIYITNGIMLSLSLSMYAALGYHCLMCDLTTH